MLTASLLLTFASPQGLDSLPELFVHSELAPTPGVSTSDVHTRRRVVTVDTDLLENTLARTGNTGALRLNFFVDDVVVAGFERLETAANGGWVWHGHVEGEADSSALFSVTGNSIAGTIRFADRFMRIEPAGPGIHYVTQADDTKFKPCGTNASHAVGSSAHSGCSGCQSAATQGGSSRSSGPVADVMIVYTTSAKNSAGGANGMNSLINLAMTETNNGMSNSLADMQVNLVHSAEMVGYSEPSSFSSMLSQLRSKTDGKLDSVHTLRDQYNADMVSMFVGGSQYCGIAYLMTNVSHSFESSAFSVVARTCATGYYSTAHEMGHNMGSAHDPGNAGSASHSYSYGFRTSNSRYRTIMAYSPGTRINRWSNPGVTYQGYTMGANNQDNARSLDFNDDTVAGWRVGTPPPPAAPVLTVPTLLAGWPAMATVENNDPGDTIFLAYSIVGAGPTNTAYGSADLSLPIHHMPSVAADSQGEAAIVFHVPQAARGLHVWFQALNYTTTTFSNGVDVDVL